MSIFNSQKKLRFLFLFLFGLLAIYQFISSFSYLVSAEAGISFYEEDAEKLAEKDSQIYRIKNDIAFTFSVNNGLLFFRQFLFDTSFNYTKRPDIEYSSNTLIHEFTHLSFLLGLKYYIYPYEKNRNIAFSLYGGNAVVENLIKSVDKGILQTPMLRRNTEMVLVPELAYFLRANNNTLLYAELRMPFFPLVATPYGYWQVLFGAEVEIDFNKSLALVREKKPLKEKDIDLSNKNQNSNTNELQLDLPKTNLQSTNTPNSSTNQ